MKQASFIIITFFFLFVNVQAQQKQKFQFTSINQLGFLTGSSDQAFQAQTVNGVRFQSWFAGLGLGLDFYGVKTIPVFADFRKNLLQKQNTPFVYLDLGASLPWKREEKGEWTTSNWEMGLYYEVGIGYAVPVNRRLAIHFSTGYSQKSLHETRAYTGGIIIDFPPYDREPQKDYYDYTYQRFSGKVALVF